MAGDNEILNMEMLNFGGIEIPETQPLVEEEEVLTNTEKKEEVPVTSEKIIVDDESQEVVDEDEEKALKEKDEKPESPANSDEVFKPLAEFLKEQGFFPNLNKEIKSAEDLAAAFQEEIKRNEFATLNEEQKAYLEALKDGVPDELYRTHQQTSTVFKSVTDEVLEQDEDIRKQLIIQDLIHSGLSPERAERQYQRIFDIGDSFEEAKTARENLIKKEEQEYKESVQQAKQREIEFRKAQEKQLEDLKATVYKQEKLFDTFNVTDGLKNKVYETMTKVVAYTEDKQPLNELMKHRMEDPIGFETKLYYLYTLTDGFKNINKFITKSTSSAAKKLRDAVNASTLIRNGGDTDYGEQSAFNGPPIVSID